MFLVYRKSKPEGSCNFRSGSNPELGAIPCPRLIYALHRFDPPAPRRRPWPAAPAIDPVFELIEIHRNAHAAHITALHLQARLEKTGRPSDVGWVSTKPCHDEDAAFVAFVAAAATTIPGLLAKLDYFAELASKFEPEWMVCERAECAVVIQSFAASLKNIGVQL